MFPTKYLPPYFRPASCVLGRWREKKAAPHLGVYGKIPNFALNEKESAMAKDKTAYVCSNCGQESSRWIGKCPSCGQWNTFKEIRVAADSGQQAARSAAGALREARRGGLGGVSTLKGGSHALPLHSISAREEPRLDMHDAELNRVLGGGLVPGSIVLLGGEPGIGKSTLTLQTILRLTDRRVLYVSGEESARQIKMRAERLADIAGQTEGEAAP